MALKALMLRKKIDAKKAKLEDLRAKAAEFQTREAELEEALGEITEESTDEERATVEAEVEALTADQEANDGAITDLEGEIAEMEGQLATEEEAQRNKAKEQQKRSVDQGRKEAREVDTMPTRIVTRFADMNIMERHKFFEDEQVRSFLGAIRAMANRRDAGSVSNAQVLIPEIMLPMLFQIVEENSKMMKHFYGPNVPGTGRVRIDGGFPEAVWTEMYGRLNEVELGYYDLEIDGYKLGGIVKLPIALIEDSDINLAQDVLNKLGRGIGYAYDKAGFYGTGTKMPLGIVTRLCQTAQPADYPTTARPWTDLHTSNVITVSQADSTGIKLFQNLARAFGKTKNAFSRGGKFWAMNDTTYNTLLVEAMNINAAGNVYSSISPDGATMPVIGGQIESLDFIPDNVIIAGYDNLYMMAERKGVQFGQSEHFLFADDMMAYKGTARYDGKPMVAEAFVAIGINGVTPTDAMTFVPDVANSVTGILLTATASVKANKTVQLTAKTLPVDADVTWTTSDATKATVSESGLVTGVAAGNATITATCGTCTAVCAVTVTSA